MKTLLMILTTGVGATMFTDLWALVRRGLFGTALPNYGLVGRWLGGMLRGELRHHSIAQARVVRGEAAIGWLAHYVIGIGFANLLLWVAGADWFGEPTLAAALITGVATVAFPFLVMQPAMGAGFAASRTPRPRIARAHSLVYHAVFGLGLYVSARIIVAASG
jgi:hypothetical protein